MRDGREPTDKLTRDGTEGNRPAPEASFILETLPFKTEGCPGVAFVGLFHSDQTLISSRFG